MNKEIKIPEGYEARIEGNKVVFLSKESENEKMARAINNMLPFIPDEAYANNGVTKEAVLNWLEKQKEQKPVEWKPQPESLEALMYAIEGKWEMIKPTSYLSRRLEDLYEGLVNTYNVNETFLAELSKTATANDIEKLRTLKDKIDASMDEKPAKCSNSVAKEMFIKALERAVEQTKKGYELTDCDKHSWWEDFKAYSEIKPVEWSEEDKTIIDCAVEVVEKAGFPSLAASIKSLRPQPKQEWDMEELKRLRKERT